MNLRTILCGIALAACANGIHADEPPLEYTFHHEHVLGTSLELRMSASSRDAAALAEQTALAEIDRLARILSRHDAESELMRWQSESLDSQKPVSEDLAHVLERAEHWRRQTTGAFDVRAAEVAVKTATLAREDRQPDLRPLASAPYTLSSSDERPVVHRHDELPISLDALAKGYIIDRVCERLRERCPDIASFSVNIGGDMRKIGNRPLPVSITNPFDPTEGSRPIHSFVASQPVAVATSGNYRRFVEVNGSRQSHIVDPRTGLPADKVASATVIALTAIDADALSTSLCVLSPNEGTALVESLDKVECLIVLTDGRQIASRGWPGKPSGPAYQLVSANDPKSEHSGLLVNFTLNRPKDGRYRRPYVAVWLEDEEGYPVKTAILWMQTEEPGPRWHRDLTRWYRNDRTRKLVEKSDLIGTISSATRGPGEYTARFDGNDDSGKPLPAGKYTLYLEVAREHGTYQIIRESVELGGKPIAKKELEGNVEMSAVSYEYIPAGNPTVAKR